jgi:hypothetical protein
MTGKGKMRKVKREKQKDRNVPEKIIWGGGGNHFPEGMWEKST